MSLRRWISTGESGAMPLLKKMAQFAERDAVVSRNGAFFSYKVMNERSDGLAAKVQNTMGMPNLNGERVAVLAEPGNDFVTAKLAVWKAGGCVVPLCTSHPKEEMEYVLSDCGVSLVIADDKYSEKAQDLSLRQVLNVGEEASGYSLVSQPSESPAILIYTSGTTGRPKGVVTRHSALQAQIDAQVQMWGWTEEDRVLNCLPLHHVHGLVNMVAVPLSVGACVEFMEAKSDKLWQRFRLGEMVGGPLTLFMAVPTVYNKMIHEFESMNPNLQKDSSMAAQRLRLMVSGSAPLPTTVMERWKEITGHTLLERYGMTEFGMALSNPLEPVEARLPGYVGKPMPGVQVRIVNEQTGAEVESDSEESGELRVKGANVFKEYWNKPQATAETFDGDGWFKTGDIAAYDPAKDSYRILGRASADIIKSGGYKISALEIERVLLEHPAISEIAVLGVPDEEYGESVSAVVKVRNGASFKEEEVKEFGRSKLAKYKVPTKYVVVDEIPKNAMGKVSKKILRTELF